MAASPSGWCSFGCVRSVQCGGGVAAVWRRCGVRRTHDDGAVAALFVLFGCFLLCEGAGLAC